MMQVYIDGKFFPQSKANVSVYDHGFLYGDGVFEGIRIYNDNIFMLDEHINRLYASAKAIKLKIPLSKTELRNAVTQTHKVNGLKSGYIRLIITRGIGDLGIDTRTCSNPSVIVLDLMMPGKDGVQVFDSIKTISPYSRIIIYTGYEHYKDSVYARKADRFVLKGADFTELLQAIKELA